MHIEIRIGSSIDGLFVIHPKLIHNSFRIHRGVFYLLKQDIVAASEVVPLTTRPLRKAEVEA
jgi:hypothetical protein